MGTDSFPIDFGRPHRTRIDVRSVAVRRNVAFCRRHSVREFAFQRHAENFFRELYDAAGELEDLYGFDTGNVIEEPTATGVHEQGMALHFEELERRRAFSGGQASPGVSGDESS